MKPVVFSKKDYESRYGALSSEEVEDPSRFREGWERACDNIKYVQNDIPRYHTDTTKFASNHRTDQFLANNNGHGEGVDNYYTFSFDYRFEHCSDTVWFAHAVPYTYTDVQTNLAAIIEGKEEICRKEILTFSLGDLPVPLLTITEKIDTFLKLDDSMALQNDLP